MTLSKRIELNNMEELDMKSQVLTVNAKGQKVMKTADSIKQSTNETLFTSSLPGVFFTVVTK